MAHIEASAPFRPLPLVLLLAALSGAAALIFELVWFQLLELYVGSSAVSLAAILSAFMGGAGLGSLLFPRIVSRKFNRWRVYAAIELGIGALGLAMLPAIPWAGGIYTGIVGAGFGGFLIRGGTAALCLATPSLLIGATLPAMVRTFDGASQRISWMGAVYAVNILGGVAGCLAAGFHLLRVYDVTIAACAAAAINIAIAAIAFAMPSPGPQCDAPEPSAPPVRAGSGRRTAALIVIALSGFCALAAEAVWTRILALLFGASTYTFSLILAVFLAGLGGGGLFGALLVRKTRQPHRALGWIQLAGALAIAWTAYNLALWLPYWPNDPSAATSVWNNLEIYLGRALWAMLPPTIVWGASFPLALAAANPERREAASVISGVYAANTLGAIAGAIAGSLLLVERTGSSGVEQILIGISAAVGLALVLPGTRTRGKAAAIAFAALCGLLIWNLPPVPGNLIAHGRYATTWTGKGEIVFAKEGLNASVAVSDFPNGVRTFHVAGKIQASTAPRDMRLQRMLGHLTTLLAAKPRSVLVIGCGAGVTAGAVSIDPRVERTTIVDIEPLVPEAARLYFAPANFDVIRNLKTAVHIDDGRHYLLTSYELFDAITADPLDPWVKGAANLYTVEFLEAAKARLNPGGAVTLYIQLFETDLDAVKSAIATFVQVFPGATAWGNTVDGRGHDMVLLGTRDPLTIDLDALEARWNDDAYAPVVQSLREVGIDSWTDLMATYAGRGPDLTGWLNGAAINRDRNLRLQYLAGLALDRDDAASIYASMLAHRRFPSALFTGAPSRVNRIRAAIPHSMR